jgi:hypothetical protein
MGVEAFLKELSMRSVSVVVSVLVSVLVSVTAFASGGHVELDDGFVRIDYADDATSPGLTDYVTLLQKENSLVSNDWNIEIYEIKTPSKDIRLGGVIYRDETTGKATRHLLKIHVPLTDKAFASYRDGVSFLSLTGQTAALLFELCKKHGVTGPSTDIRYDFGKINCHKDPATGSSTCTIFDI